MGSDLSDLPCMSAAAKNLRSSAYRSSSRWCLRIVHREDFPIMPDRPDGEVSKLLLRVREVQPIYRVWSHP